MISTALMSLNMSGQEEKGKNTFDSPIVIATSNTPVERFHTIGVNNFLAVADRIGLNIKLQRGNHKWREGDIPTLATLDKCWKFTVMPGKGSRDNQILRPGNYVLSAIMVAIVKFFDNTNPATLNDSIMADFDFKSCLTSIMKSARKPKSKGVRIGGEEDLNFDDIEVIGPEPTKQQQEFKSLYDTVNGFFNPADQFIPRDIEPQFNIVEKGKGKEKAVIVNEHMLIEEYWLNYFEVYTPTHDYNIKWADVELTDQMLITCVWFLATQRTPKVILKHDDQILRFRGCNRMLEFGLMACHTNDNDLPHAAKVRAIMDAFADGRRPMFNGLKSFLQYYADMDDPWWKFKHPTRTQMILSAVAAGAIAAAALVAGVTWCFNEATEAYSAGQTKGAIRRRNKRIREGWFTQHSETKLAEVSQRKKAGQKATVTTGRGFKLVAKEHMSSSHVDRTNVSIANKIIGNISQISFSMDGEYYEAQVFATFIKNHVAVTVRHAVQYKKWKYIRLAPLGHNSKSPGGTKTMSMDSVNVQSFEGREDVYLTFGSDIGDQPDVSKHVLEDESIQDIRYIIRIGTEGNLEGGYKPCVEDVVGSVIRGEVEAILKPSNNVVVKKNYYTMTSYGRPGECGLPVLGKDRNGAIKILGIYFGAGKDHKVGLFAPIREFEVLSSNKNSEMMSYVEEHMTGLSDRFLAGVHPAGKVDVFYKGTGKTDYVPSMLVNAWLSQGNDLDDFPLQSGKIPVIRESVTYHYEDGTDICISPWHKANSNFIKTGTPAMSKEFLEIMNKRPRILYGNVLETVVMDKKYKSLSIEEVLFGGKYTRQQDRSTSTGFFGLATGIKDRKELFARGEDGKDNYIHPLFHKAIVEAIDKAESGITPGFVNVQSLKDELLDISDVENHKVRMFAVADLVQLVLLATTVGQAVNTIKRDMHSPFILGVNLHSIDASLLRDKLYRFGNKSGGKGAGDVKAMDASVFPRMAHLMAIFFNEFYCYKEGTKEYNRLYAACHSVIIVYWMRGDNF